MSKKLEDLSKINFWDGVKVLYPKTMVYFNLWIDGYKKDNDWDMLFNQNKFTNTLSPKFHDLPFAMQFGIFTHFLAEQGDTLDELIGDFKSIVLDCFKETERAL